MNRYPKLELLTKQELGMLAAKLGGTSIGRRAITLKDVK